MVVHRPPAPAVRRRRTLPLASETPSTSQAHVPVYKVGLTAAVRGGFDAETMHRSLRTNINPSSSPGGRGAVSYEEEFERAAREALAAVKDC